MFENLRKSVENIKNINPKALWLSFSQSQKVRHRDYLNLLMDNNELKSIADMKRLEVMVGEEIKTIFPDISGNTFDLLVDATMHHIRKKQLQATDDICFK